MVKVGTTLIPLVGWTMDARERQDARARHLEAIRTLVEKYRVQAIELNGDFALLYPQVIDKGYYEEVAELQEELGFMCTLHLPFLWVDGASLNEPIRRATAQSIRRVLELTQPLDVESYVLHLWGIWTSMLAGVQQLSAKERHSLISEILRRAESSLVELADLVPPASVCVENLAVLPFEPIAAMAERQGMSICLDVGHLTTDGGDALLFLARHWDKIGEIHLHDALIEAGGAPNARDHLPLGAGKVDYVALMETLEERGYDKVLILEMNNEADLSQSLEKLERWL
jgi:sugar phosphate isomerase/epimerase